MKQLWFILAAAALAGACATDTKPSDPATEGEANKVSGMSFSLTSVDSQGRPYRLRNATFAVDSEYYYYGYDAGTPPVSTVLSTETDPDANQLSVRLVPGPYTVSLGGDWYIERLGANGPERVEQVVLLTDAVQYAYVSQDWNYDVNYRFGVDGTLIDFRHGDLSVDIGIELPSDHVDDGGSPINVYDAGPIFIFPEVDAGI